MMLRLKSCSAVLVGLGVLSLANGNIRAGLIVNGNSEQDNVRVIEWGDPGFESTTDFTTGVWEVGEARLSGAPTHSEWEFSVVSSGGNPGSYVYINDTPDDRTGFAFVGQHLTIPTTSQLLSVEVFLDVQKYCPYSDEGVRGGGIGFALFTNEEWRKMDKSIPLAETPFYSDISKLWDMVLWDPTTPDLTTWTRGVVPPADCANLLTALNENKGQDLVLATYFYAWHFNPEWARIDNFHVIPEPSTITLLAMGAVGILAYGWRTRNKN